MKKTITPPVMASDKPIAINAGIGDANPKHAKAERVGRQAQGARPLAPYQFHEAENDQGEAERSHRADDRIAIGEPRSNEPAIGERDAVAAAMIPAIHPTHGGPPESAMFHAISADKAPTAPCARLTTPEDWKRMTRPTPERT